MSMSISSYSYVPDTMNCFLLVKNDITINDFDYIHNFMMNMSHIIRVEY